MEELATEVRAEHRKTGRAITEILDAMRDEGYIDLSDAEMVVCAAMAMQNRDSREGVDGDGR